MSIHDKKTQELVQKTAEKLKPVIQVPSWAKLVKTSPSRERPPMDSNWWYSRAASMLRKIYILGPIGTNKLSRKYGGRQRRGHKPGIFKRGSRKIIRTILQQFDKAGLTKQAVKDNHKGRILTKKGKSFLEKKNE
jgi:small subunit ribosomal protein S19e